MNWKTIAVKRQSVKDKLIVGIDIAKKLHVAKALLPSGEFMPALKFHNDLAGFTKLIDYIRRYQNQAHCDGVTCAFESTGHYGMCLIHWVQGHGLTTVWVNPVHVKRTRDQFDNSPAGSDSKSAMVIADLASQGKFLTVVIPTGVYASLRETVVMRDHLMAERTAKLNQLQAALDRLFPEFTDVFKDIKGRAALYLLEHYPSPQEILGKSAAELTQELRQNGCPRMSQKKIDLLQVKARETVGVKEAWVLISAGLIDALAAVKNLNERIKVLEELLKNLVPQAEESEYLLSVRGIGVISTAVLLGETGGWRNYGHARAVLKLAGLNVYVVQSGQYEGAHRISKRGRGLLRKVLFLAALRLIRIEGEFKEFYTRLIGTGKVRKIKAVVAVACRLVRVLYALVRDRRHYSDRWSGPSSVTAVAQGA